MMEEKEPGEFVITVKACDADLDPKIFYRIIGEEITPLISL